MFDNPSEKIKNAANILFRLSLICSAIILIVGFGMFIKAANDSYDIEFLGKCYESDDDLKAAGWMNVLYSILLVPASYLSSLLIYGFGELIEKNEIFAEALSSQKTKPDIYKSLSNGDTYKSPANNTAYNDFPSHQWRCNNCGKMISGDFCPVCDKEAADKLYELDSLLKSGLITDEEYNEKKNELRNTHNV